MITDATTISLAFHNVGHTATTNRTDVINIFMILSSLQDLSDEQTGTNQIWHLVTTAPSCLVGVILPGLSVYCTAKFSRTVECALCLIPS